jgi:hypothetical protein
VEVGKLKARRLRAALLPACKITVNETPVIVAGDCCRRLFPTSVRHWFRQAQCHELGILGDQHIYLALLVYSPLFSISVSPYFPSND